MSEEDKQFQRLVSKGKDTDIPEGQTGRLTMCKQWFEEAKQHNKSRFERMRKNEEMYYNRVKVVGYKNKIKINLALADIETQLPIISDFMPTFDVVPQEDDDVAFADMMQNRKRSIEESTKLRIKAILSEKSSLIYGNGIIGALPIRGNNKGFNGFDIDVVDPFTWLPPADATGMDIRDSAPYQIFATPMRTRDIERKYSVTGVKAEGNLNEFRAYVAKKDGNAGESDKNKLSDMALVKECFFMDDDGNQWLMTWVNEGSVLWDAKLEIPRIPYFDIANYRDAHTCIGVGEPELISTVSQALNEGLSGIADNVKSTGNPLRIIRKSFWAEMKGKIFGRPDEEILVNQPDDVTYLQPPTMPVYAFRFIELLMQLTDVVTGIHDVTQGKKPSGITAASAIQALQEAAQSRVRFKISTEISGFMDDVGEFIVWCLQTYDEEVKTVRVKDIKTGNYEFKPWDPKTKLGKDGKPAEDGKTLGDSHFEIETVTGFRLPTGRVAAEEQAIVRFEKGIYGIERLAANINEPNKKELIEEWYARNGGDKRMIPDEVREQFRQLAMQYTVVVQSGDDFSELENEIFRMLQEFPTLIETADFIMFIPEAQKERLLEALRVTALESMEAESA